jgi:hypothetical protein
LNSSDEPSCLVFLVVLMVMVRPWLSVVLEVEEEEDT